MKQNGAEFPYENSTCRIVTGKRKSMPLLGGVQQGQICPPVFIKRHDKQHEKLHTYTPVYRIG